MGGLFQCRDIGYGFDRFVLFSKLIVADYLGCAYNYAAWVKIIIECFAFTEKLRREQQVELLYALACILDIQATAIAYRNGGFNHHDGIGIDT